MAISRIVGLALIVSVLAACGSTTAPTQDTAVPAARGTTPPAAATAAGALPLSPEEALTAAAAEANAAGTAAGAVPLSPEEALTAAAAEATEVAAGAGPVQLSPEEALTAAAAEATEVAAGAGPVQLSPEEALTAAAAEATVAPTPGVVQLSPDEALTAAAAEPTTVPASPTTIPESELESVTLGLGYIPNIQFAPFYVAAAKGYYAAEGLKVELSYGGNVNDLLLQTATGQLPFVLAAGDEVLVARSRGVPIKMVSLIFQQVPVAIFSKASAGIVQPADLRGKTIGLPGRYGATYIALRGLLHSQNMQENDVTLTEIGFTQFEAVEADRVPAAVGYANNEPLRLADSGATVNVIKVADYINLVSNGIVTSESFAAERPETVRKFIRATLRGLQDTFTNPDEAFNLSLQFIPELAADQQPFQRRVLADTINYWKPANGDTATAGSIDPEAWQTTYTFLRESGILTDDTDPTQAYSTEFLP